MSELDSGRITQLLGHLNKACVRALDEAAGLAISRTHHEVGIEHWLLKLLEQGDGDVPVLLKAFGIEEERLWNAVLGSIEGRYRGGNVRTPSFSPALFELMEEARRFSLVELESPRIRSGSLLFAMLSASGSRLPEGLQLLDNIPPARLRREFRALTAGSAESDETLPIEATAAQAEPTSTSRASLQQARVPAALDKYTLDLTLRARNGEIDPVFGREAEISQLIDILSRRRKNNPVLVGEPGVGKTAIVEGLALQIVRGEAPEALKALELRTLDLGLLQAGAGTKGEFESRLRAIVDDVKDSPAPVLLFIDEVHTLIDAGDAANLLLKPAPGRGELRTIASTSWGEYKQHFERDAALERRFQRVQIDEPSEASAVRILRGLKSRYEAFHGVNITDDAVLAAVKLSTRYIPARQLPDKAVDLIDTACARVKMSTAVQPAVLSLAQEAAQALRCEREALERDLSLARAEKPAASRKRLAEIDGELIRILGRQVQMQTQLEREQQLLQELQDCGARLRDLRVATPGADAQVRLTALQETLQALRTELAAVQGGAPLVHLDVGVQAVAGVVADWTGIPAGRMLEDEVTNLLGIETRLGERVVGQPAAIAQLAEGIRQARLGLLKRDAPMGVFLLVGPSGVGKTETALAIADLLYAGARSVTTLSMSEYQETHSVSRLIGSLGCGQGGVLTEAVRLRPHGVLLLEEIEMAHRDVMSLLCQVFDRGFLRDGEGREIDFRNTLILMSSKLGGEAVTELCRHHDKVSAAAALEHIRPELLARFQPALLARMQVVPYLPLGRDHLAQIVGLKLDRLAECLKLTWNIQAHATEELRYVLADECNTPDGGARAIDRLIEQNLLPSISHELLSRMSRDALPVAIFISTDAHEGINIDYVHQDEEIAEIRQALDIQSAAQGAARLLAQEAHRMSAMDAIHRAGSSSKLQ